MLMVVLVISSRSIKSRTLSGGKMLGRSVMQIMTGWLLRLWLVMGREELLHRRLLGWWVRVVRLRDGVGGLWSIGLRITRRRLIRVIRWLCRGLWGRLSDWRRGLILLLLSRGVILSLPMVLLPSVTIVGIQRALFSWGLRRGPLSIISTNCWRLRVLSCRCCSPVSRIILGLLSRRGSRG